MHQQSVRMFCPCVTCMQFHFSVALWYTGLYTWILNKLRWNISPEKIRDFPTSHHGCLCKWLDSSWDPQSPKVTYQGARYQKPEQPCYQKVPRLSTKNAVTHNLLLTQPWIQKKFMGRCFGLWKLVFCRHCVKTTSILSAQEESHCLQNGTKGT